MRICSTRFCSILDIGLDLLVDVLRIKNNRQPTVILKALSIDVQPSTKTRSILAELRDKVEPNKKIIVAISQKSLDQFLHEVKSMSSSFDVDRSIMFYYYRRNN
jgi:hypothetical protein